MTNPPLPQLPKERERQRERKKFLFSFANLCKISAPLGMEKDDP